MVYRYGKRVKIWKQRMWERSFLITAAGILCMAGTVFAVNKRLAKVDNGSHKGPGAQASNNKSRSNKTSTTNSSQTAGTTLGANSTEGLVLKDCAVSQPPHTGLASSIAPELQKLAEYEKLCGGAIASRMMTFLAMPANSSEAVRLAKDASYTLKEFARFGIEPLVILEPQTSQGFINFGTYKSGSYDAAMDTYFATLKAQGITDAMMGTWVPFPESNIPEWGNTNPSDVSAGITKTAQFQKKYFPTSKVAVLLDSKSYPNGNSWEGGSYASLVPYVKDIPKGLVDSFGLQGYPWPDTEPDYSAGHFVNPALAQEAANVLGVHEVWLSTGTFSKGKAWNGKTITLTPTQRQAILTDILNQAKKLQAQGFTVGLNLFAENKFTTSEGIDWSYWSGGEVDTSPSTGVLKTFVHDLRANSIDLWLFDSTEID